MSFLLPGSALSAVGGTSGVVEAGAPWFFPEISMSAFFSGGGQAAAADSWEGQQLVQREQLGSSEGKKGLAPGQEK